jgi:micrococcal nuclease
MKNYIHLKFLIVSFFIVSVGGFSSTPGFAQTKSSVLIAAADKKEETVYITKTGKKYHRSTCGHLKQSKIAVTRKQAQEMGLTPCKHCNPDN